MEKRLAPPPIRPGNRVAVPRCRGGQGETSYSLTLAFLLVVVGKACGEVGFSGDGASNRTYFAARYGALIYFAEDGGMAGALKRPGTG